MTHWRRNGQLGRDYSLPSRLVVASACGRLVDKADGTRSPTEADCPECHEVIAGLAELDAARNRSAFENP